MITSVFISAFIVMLASLVGVIFVWKQFGKWVEQHLSYLVSFSIGVFLVVIYNLGLEAVEMELTLGMFIGWAVLGVVVLELGGRLIPKAHHHHEFEHDHPHTRVDARRMLLGDAIHNIGDGILLVPAFLVDIRIGIATTTAVFLHELVQELSEFFVLRDAGHSTKKALVLNFLVSSTILMGVVLSLYVSSYAERFVGLLIAFAAGGFLYVVFRDLLPNTFTCMKKQGSIVLHLLAIILGLVVMFAVGLIV